MASHSSTSLGAIFRSRSAVLAAAATALVVIVGPYLLLHRPLAPSWRLFGVYAWSPAFADLRTITYALDAVRHGVNPYVDTSFDLWGRTYNYPRAWLWLSNLGLGASATDVIGVGMAALLTAALSVYFETRTLATRAVTFLGCLSPPVMLLVERGNCDAVIFGLLVMGLWATSGLKGPRQAALRSLVIVALTVLKVYPDAAAVTLLKRRSPTTIAIVGATVLIAAGALIVSLQPGDLGHIFENTPQSRNMSFGSFRVFSALAGGVEGGPLRQVASLTALGVIGLCLLVSLTPLKSTLKGVFPVLREGVLADDVAFACASIFLFAFVLGVNFDYRLIFLFAILAPLLRAYDEDRDLRRLAFPVFAVGFLHLTRLTSRLYPVDEVVDWTAFIGCALWFTSTLADRLLPGRQPASAGQDDASGLI